MSPARAWWLLLVPGGLVLAPLAWWLLRRRARRPGSKGRVLVLDLTGMTGIERDEERAS